MLSGHRSHKTKCATQKVAHFVFVAGPGIEPGSGGYAYHYSFRYSAPMCMIWGLDYTFIFLLESKVRCLPSSLYTFQDITIKVWLGIAMLMFATSEGFTEFGKDSITHFCIMSPLEPPEVPLLYPARSNAEEYTPDISSCLVKINIWYYYLINICPKI